MQDVVPATPSTILVKKMANAFYTNVRFDETAINRNPALSTLSNSIPHLNAEAKSASKSVVGAFKWLFGGLWVGGYIYLTVAELTFQPSQLNKQLQPGVSGWCLPLGEIICVSSEFGFVTGIIAVRTRTSVNKFRCWGARKLARRIREAIKSHQDATL